MQTSKKALLFVDEFKNFALKGNVIDLAVGVIIGSAFGKLVDALVKHLLMPAIGVILPGERGYLGWKLLVGGKEIPYGLFLGEVMNFLIISLALFIFMVKFLGWLTRAQQMTRTPPPVLTREQELLTEIRDLLKKTQP